MGTGPRTELTSPGILQMSGRPGGCTGLVVGGDTQDLGLLPLMKPRKLGLVNPGRVGVAIEVGGTMSPATLGEGVGRALALEPNRSETQTWLQDCPALWSYVSLNSPEPTFPSLDKSGPCLHDGYQDCI